MSDGSSSFFGNIARLGSFGQFIGFAGSAVVAIAATSIWTTDYLRKIDSSDKRITELQEEVTRLQSDLKKVDLRFADITSNSGAKGERGPEGPAGPRGEKGEKGDPGEPGAANVSDNAVTAAVVAKMIEEQFSKLPKAAAGTTVAGLPLVAGDDDCIILKSTEAKFRFSFKAGQKFCLADGELAVSVKDVDLNNELIRFNQPSQGNYACRSNSVCNIREVLPNYEYHIESFQDSMALVVFKKKN